MNKKQYKYWKKELSQPSCKELMPKYAEVEKYYLMLKDFPEVMRGKMSFEGEDLISFLRCQNFMIKVMEILYKDEKDKYDDLIESVKVFKKKLKDSDKNIKEAHDEIIGLHKSVIEDSEEQIENLDEQVKILDKKDKIADKLINSQNEKIDIQNKIRDANFRNFN